MTAILQPGWWMAGWWMAAHAWMDDDDIHVWLPVSSWAAAGFSLIRTDDDTVDLYEDGYAQGWQDAMAQSNPPEEP